MIIFKTIPALRSYLQLLNSQNKSVGFVPTMGALHAGHLSLIHQAQTVCDVTVVSIFVNPTQFNDATDFEKYPVTIEKDCLLLEQQRTDILFLPRVTEMYPEGPMKYQHFDLGNLETVWEGRYRPGHFQGVCQVVKRLLEIVEPDQLFLGQKDYQQCKVIQRLIALTGMTTTLNIVPTLRETNGLAMSSRNVRLHTEERQSAAAIYQQLTWIKENLAIQSFEMLVQQATAALLAAGFSKVDYVAIADSETLQPAAAMADQQKLIAMVAAFMGEVRLIDNLLLN
jgi:pantoate--beta-alanine ligase